MVLSKTQRSLLAKRFTELLREVGTLVLAFAPLDYMLQPQLEPWSLCGFVVIGLALFLWSWSASSGGRAMTWGWVASFGGIVAAMLLIRLVEYFLVDRAPDEDGPDNAATDVAAALERAEAAARQAEEEIARARIALDAAR